MQLDIDQGIDLLYGRFGPTAKQAEFRDCPARYKLFGGAVGGGKSVAICAEAIRLSLAYPGNRGFLCRHESKAFVNTTLKTLLKLIAEIESLIGQRIMSNHHKTDRVIYFLNSSEILYGGLGEASDVERIKSLEIGFFGIDEASETVLDNFRMLKSRLRWRLPSGQHPPFQGLLASNPEPGWVKDIFVTPQQLGEPLPGHRFIQSLPSDNPHLPPDYVEDLKATNPESWVRKYIEGNWDALEGQVYPMFNFNIHVIEPFEIPYEWTRFRAIDHGQSNPTACLWFAVDYDGNLYVYREYYQTGVVSTHCREINALSEEEPVSYTVLPPDTFAKTREKNGRPWSVADEYREHGIVGIRANNNVLAGINRVAEYLTVREDRIHPLKAEYGSPKLFFFRNCKNLLKEIINYAWSKQSSDVSAKERPVKLNDHAVDALRYGVMSLPAPTRRATTIPYDSFLETRKRLIRATKLSQRLMADKGEIYDLLTRRVYAKGGL